MSRKYGFSSARTASSTGPSRDSSSARRSGRPGSTTSSTNSASSRENRVYAPRSTPFAASSPNACRIRAAPSGSYGIGYCPSPIPRTIRDHGVAITRVSLDRWRSPSTGTGNGTGNRGRGVEVMGVASCRWGVGGRGSVRGVVRQRRHPESQEIRPRSLQHLQRPVQPLDALAVDGDRAALGLVGAGQETAGRTGKGTAGGAGRETAGRTAGNSGSTPATPSSSTTPWTTSPACS